VNGLRKIRPKLTRDYLFVVGIFFEYLTVSKFPKVATETIQ
ncbi:uncharacterized protein METZ01_LOCUS474502, partial [marine metagenome]